MDRIVAELTLAETAARRHRTAELVRASMAVPLRLLALAWIVLCPIALIFGRNHLGPFVAMALLLVTILAWRQYRRIGQRHGFRTSLWPWLGVALVAIAGGVAASQGGTQHALPWLNTAGPFIVNALSLLALAWFIRSSWLAYCVAAMVCSSVATIAVLSGDAAVAVQLGLYATLLAATSTRMEQ
jgi:hypothetical protein